MSKLSSHKASSTHRVLIFGPPKTGKTLLAGKLAEFYDLIWVDLENGHETLFQLPQEWQERIELIAIPDTRSFPVAIETVLKMVKGKVSICELHGKVACMICKKESAATVEVDLPGLKDNNKIVVFDSSTQLTNSAISHITKGKPDDYKLDYDDWGNLGKLMDIFFSHIQQAGYNVIVISHETEAETEGKKSKLVPVAGTRNFSRNVAKYFDHVVYAEVKSRKHTFASSTTYNTTILTGSRTGAVLETQAEPSLLPIFKPELFEAVQLVTSTGVGIDLATGEPRTKTTIKEVKTATTTTGGESAKDILARLKNKSST